MTAFKSKRYPSLGVPIIIEWMGPLLLRPSTIP